MPAPNVPRWAAPAPQPRTVLVAAGLARDLGLDTAELAARPEILAGGVDDTVPTFAQDYAGLHLPRLRPAAVLVRSPPPARMASRPRRNHVDQLTLLCTRHHPDIHARRLRGELINGRVHRKPRQ
ncbi:MAG: hypothetical protein IPK37_06375 [Austwickia sp.]|nr:MAG: hypothetical protein IPK37_06375 [Austwickia sp.]